MATVVVGKSRFSFFKDMDLSERVEVDRVLFLYNFLMLFVDMRVLALFKKSPKVLISISVVFVAWMLLVLGALLLGTTRFNVMRLLTYGVFLHGLVIQFAWAVLLWCDHRMTSQVVLLSAASLAVIGGDILLLEPT